MTDKDLIFLQECIQYLPEGESKDRATLLISKALTDAMEQKIRKKRAETKPAEAEEGDRGKVKFTKSEFGKMPEMVRTQIEDNLVPVTYRYHHKVYEIRYRRSGYDVYVSATDFEVAKRRFLNALAKGPKRREYPTFKEYSEIWLKYKKPMVKECTYAGYTRILRLHLLPVFGDKPIDMMTRTEIQELLYRFVDEGKSDKADRCKKILGSIFDLAADDYGIKNPMKRVTLPHYEQKKGAALSIAEEKKLVDYCVGHTKCKVSSALLILLYTGMRVGELASMAKDGDIITCVSEKTRKGYADVIRRIPVSPMMKKVISHIDFDAARDVSRWSIRDTFLKIFPDRHVHELRYTFITRAKECGINPEVVMLVDGHTADRDCKTSKIDRGYTDFSEEYILKEMEKYSYDLNV